MLVLDFSTPQWLLNYYHVIGTVSIILNSLGVYLLMFQSEKLDRIRYYMLAYQISCFAADVHITFLMQPVPLYPIFAGVTVGALSEWFGVPSHYCMMLVTFLITLELELLVLCFEKKHQTIANTLNTHVLPKWFLGVCYGLCVFSPIFVSVGYHCTRLDKDEQWVAIQREWPQYFTNFQHLPHFDFYIRTRWFTVLILLTIAGGFVLGVFFLVFILDIFRMMASLKLRISALHYQKHKLAMRSLMVQFATSSFCVIPPCCFVIVVILELEHAQLLVEILLLWFATHSSANMTGLLIFFPPYRTFIWKKLKLEKSVGRLIKLGNSSSGVQPSIVNQNSVSRLTNIS